MATGWLENRNTKRTDRWTMRIEVRDPLSGKTRTHTRTVTAPNKTRAKVLLKQELAKYETDDCAPPSAVTFNKLLHDWIEACRSRLEVTTVSGYEIAVRKHIVPALGNVKLSELQPLRLQRLYTGLLAAGYSKRTVQWVHTVCSAALKQGVQWGMLSRNPASKVTPPRPQKQTMQTIALEDVPAFLKVVRESPLASVIELALYTGMRRGELCGLRWDDVDLENGCINVSRNMVRVKKQTLVKNTKTDHSRRLIVLPRAAVVILASLPRSGETVFTHKSKPVVPSSLTKRFQELMLNTKFEGLRFHDLRHSHASLFLKAGGHFKVLQERLGHGSYSTTMDIYAHLVPDMQREGVRLFDEQIASTYQNPTKTTEKPRPA
jgi:integrase